MARIYNFSAGPSMLPEEVLKTAAAEMLEYGATGQSVMEMSHRSKEYQAIIDAAESDLRDIMNIPDNYAVLFLQGGASTQFAMVPMNLMTKNKKADYIVIESTYGNRLHGERPDYVAQLTRIIQETFDKGGNVIIPSFAIGRTQELLYLLRIIKEQRLIKGYENFPVYVDSTLAVVATEIYSGSMTEYYDDETLELLEQGINPIKFPNLRLSVTSDDSMAINRDHTPKIILSASGMCEAGRIRHHLKHNLWRPESTILFVGYQSEGTLGRIIIEGAPTVKLFGETIQVKANIEQLAGISGHADEEILLDWLKGFEKKPKTVFVNHGSDTVCDEFAETVNRELSIFATAPYNGAEYDLVAGICLEKGNMKRISKPAIQGARRESSAFQRLLNAGRRLMSVIEQYREGANKDIAKFADQIISLCEKWDK